MSTFAKQFQEEIKRLARKELKEELIRLKAENTDLKKSISDLRKRLDKMERSNRRVFRKVVAPEVLNEAEESPRKDAGKARISSKTIITLRQRLGLTQAQLGKLLGVSGQSVYQWERKNDRLTLRSRALQAVVEAKSMGIKEARAKLGLDS